MAPTTNPDDDLIARLLLAVEADGPDSPAVAELVRTHPALAGVLADVVGFQRGLGQALPPAETFLSAGDRLGEFVIRRRVNQGGMGVIYEAEQTSLGRAVALKTIRQRGSSPLARERFERERKALARLHETHVVTVLASGTAGQLDYFAMPFIRGESVREAVARGGSPPARVADLLTRTGGTPGRPPAGYFASVVAFFIPLAEAVHRVHEHGLLHRDLTPSNVMIDDRGDGWVIDFGLSAERGAGASSTADGSPAGSPSSGRLGTPRYMAPEQCEGIIGVPADVWGLGVVLWELLALEPFDRDRLTAPAGGLSGVPNSLAAVCRKALAQQPGDRYPTAQALADDLRRWQSHEPVAARRYGPVERSALWVRRNPVKATAAAALLLVAVASTVFSKLAWDSREAEASARQDETRAKEAARESERQLAVALGQAEQGEKDAREQQRVAELRQANAECLGGSMALRAGDFDRADLLFRSANRRMGELSADNFLARAGATAVHTQSPPPLIRIEVPGGGMRALAVSADGTHAVVSHTRTSFDLYHLPTGRLVRTFDGGHQKMVTSLALSADGKRVVSGGFDGGVCVWEVETGQKVAAFDPLGGPVTAVAASKDGSVVAAGTGYLGEEQGGVLLRQREGPFGQTRPVNARLAAWAVGGEKSLDRTAAHSRTITSLALSADGKRLVAGGHDEKVTWWDVPGGKRLNVFSGAGAPIEHVALAPDNLMAVAACTNGGTFMCLLDADDSAPRALLPLTEKTGAVLDAVVSPNFAQAMYSTRDGMVRLFDTASGNLLRVFTGPGGGKRVNKAAFLPGGLVLLATDETVEVYPAAGGSALRRLPGRSPARAWAVSADGRRVLSAHSDGVARLWALSPDQVVGVANAPKGGAVALSADGKLALTAGPELRLWRTDTGETLGVLDDSGEVAAAAFSPDGKRVAAGRRDGVIRGWTLADRKPLWEETLPAEKKDFSIELVQSGNRQVLLPPDPDAKPKPPVVGQVLFSPDGTRVLCSASGRATLREADTGRVVCELAGSGRDGYAFSADGRWVCGSGRGDSGRVELVVWDAASGRREHLWPLVFATAPTVTAVGFSPDSAHVVALLADGTLVAVGRADGREMHSHKLPVKGIASAAFSAGVRVVAFTDETGGGGVYDLGRVDEVWSREERFAAARTALNASPDDPQARADLGRWYAFRGATDWARPLLTDPDTAGDLADCLLRRDDFRQGDWAAVAKLRPADAPPRGPMPFDPSPAALRDVQQMRTPDTVVSVSNDRKRLLLSGATAEVFRLRAEKGKLALVFGAHLTGGPAPVAGDGTALFGGDKNRLLLMDLTAHPPMKVRELTSPADSRTLGGSAVSADGKTVVAGYADGRVLVWSGNGSPTVIPPPADGTAETRKADPALDRWAKRLASAREPFPLGVSGLALDDATGLIVVGYGYGEGSGYPGYLAAFDATTGEARGGFLTPSAVTAVRLTPDGRRAAVGLADGSVLVAAVADGRLDRPTAVGKHVGPVRCVEFAADRLFSGGADQELVGWDWAAGKKVCTFRHRSEVTSVAATADGQLVSTAADGRVYLWATK